MDWSRLVQEVLDEARRSAGSGPALAERLEAEGVGSDGRYSESAISNWIKGRTMPPADVLLAAAALGGISLDLKLATTSVGEDDDSATGEPGPTIEEKIAGIQHQISRLDALLEDLYLRTGHPYHRDRQSEGHADHARTIGA